MQRKITAFKIFIIAGCFCVLVFLILRSGSEKHRVKPVFYDSLSRKELILFCGAGIRTAAEELIRVFEEKYLIKISATYAGGGRQLGQIVSMQKGDLFMPGAEFYVDRAIEKGLAEIDTKRIVAYFVPVIFVREGNPKEIQNLNDLSRKGIRVGMGDERACAIGKKTLKILEKNGISYKDIQQNIIYKSGTVNELGLAIQLGNVDAVILWDANARHFAEHGDVVPIPADKNIPSSIPIVLLKSSEYFKEAGRFIDFVTSREGKKILTEQGYTVTLDPGLTEVHDK